MTYHPGMLTIAVNDLPRAKAFYIDVLGFKAVPELSSDTWVFLHSPAVGIPIALQIASSTQSAPSGDIAGFRLDIGVEDVDQAWNELKAKGVEGITDIYDMGAGRAFDIKDPEGHTVGIYRLYPQVIEMQKQLGIQD